MKPLDIARRRRSAWMRIIDAVADMRDALEYRVQREDDADTRLRAACKTWCELARALADFLKARRSSP